MEVGARGLQSQSHPQGARTPDWPAQTHNSATSPLRQAPDPEHPSHSNHPGSVEEKLPNKPTEKDPVTGEGGKGTPSTGTGTPSTSTEATRSKTNARKKTKKTQPTNDELFDSPKTATVNANETNKR